MEDDKYLMLGSNKTTKTKKSPKRKTRKFRSSDKTNPISLRNFLKEFESKEQVTFQEFLNKAIVKVGKNETPLKKYMEKKHINKSKIKLLFENIQNRNEYLTRFYNMSLRVDSEEIHIIDEPMKNNEMNNNEKINYKNVIRSLYYKDILEKTKSGIENVPTFMDVLKDLYLKNVIDYKILTPSALAYMKKGRLGSVFSSFYFRASIMNPYLVYSLNESVLNGTRIFTPTLGWSSYCYGFLESPKVLEYVGTDVIPSVCEKTQRVAKMIAPQKTVDIYCKPSEEFLSNKAFMNKYREHFDVVFFSPPYYELEIYEGGKQSTEQYKTYEEWLEKYWEKTIQLCHSVLEKGGRLCYILSGYGSDNTKEKYDLIGDMNKITKRYFTMKSSQPMYNKDVHSTKHKETAEMIMIFTK